MTSAYSPSKECIHCHQRPDNFFCALSQESLNAFNQIKHGSLFPEGATICIEGQAPRGVFMLCEGQAKLCITSRIGRTFIVRIAKPGEVIGLHAVITGKPYEVTVETMQPSQLTFVERRDFLRFLKDHGDACLRAAQHIERDCQEARDVIRSIGSSHSIPGRVAEFLLAAAGDGEALNGAVCVKLGLTREDISQLVGASREKISRTLSEFRKKGIIELKHSTLTIRDKSALERLVTA